MGGAITIDRRESEGGREREAQQLKSNSQHSFKRKTRSPLGSTQACTCKTVARERDDKCSAAPVWPNATGSGRAGFPRGPLGRSAWLGGIRRPCAPSSRRIRQVHLCGRGFILTEHTDTKTADVCSRRTGPGPVPESGFRENPEFVHPETSRTEQRFTHFRGTDELELKHMKRLGHWI